MSHNYIFYTHTRINFKDYIDEKLIVNSITVFSTFFVAILSIFIFSYYIEPAIGIITYRPDQLIGLTNQELLHYEEYMFTFSQLIKLSPLLMGIIYSFWVGLNAVVYSTMAMLSLVVVDNIFIALSVPFIFYHIGSFIVAIMGFEYFLFNETIFPFAIAQQSLITIIPPFIIVVGINLWLYWQFTNQYNSQ